MNRTSDNTARAILLVKALLASYIVSALLLLVLALVLYKVDPPSGVISIGIVLTYIVSAFIAGLIIGKRAKQRRFFWGILMGLAYFLIIFVVAIVMGKDVFGDFAGTLTVMLMCGLGGMLGGMVS